MAKRDLALLAALYGAWLVCAYVINAATTGARTPADSLHEWVRFDGIYFRAIAEFGYDEASRIIRWQQGFPFLTAAFPLFPLRGATGSPRRRARRSRGMPPATSYSPRPSGRLCTSAAAPWLLEPTTRCVR